MALVEGLASIGGIGIVGPTHDRQRALEMFEEHKPNFVVLDLQMPDASDLLSVICKLDPYCLVIGLTGRNEIDMRPRCVGRGADFMFNKMNELDRVVDVVREFRQAYP